MGFEYSTSSLGKMQLVSTVPISVPTSETILLNYNELLELWYQLDESARDDLLRVARAWVASK
jgi:hypothetical protein